MTESQSKDILPQGSSLGQISVKLYPELCAAALKAKLDKELALWYELRAINVNGSSRLVLNDAVAALVEHLDYTQSTAYRLLKAGKGKLWDIKNPPLNALTAGGQTTLLSGRSNLGSGFSTTGSDALKKTPASCRLPVGSGVPESTAPVRGGQGDYSIEWHSTIKLYGLERVAEYLGVSGLGRLVEVPASVFRGRGVKSAWLYASFFKPDGFKSKPISRDSLKAITGVSRRSQVRYDKVAGTRRTANFAVQDDGKGGFVPVLESRPGKNKQYLTVRRLGNNYHSKAMIAPRGMVKKVNAELRHRSLERDEASCVPKRFFISAKSLLQCHCKGPEPFLLVAPWERLIKGRLEWSLA